MSRIQKIFVIGETNIKKSSESIMNSARKSEESKEMFDTFQPVSRQPELSEPILNFVCRKHVFPRFTFRRNGLGGSISI